MKVKWCVSDIDGTITNSKKEINPRIIETVRRYESSGGTFILATGRTMLTAREIVERFGLSTPVISGNGSVIKDAEGGTLLCHKISREASLSASEYAIAEGFDFVAFSTDVMWYPYNSLRVEYFKKKNEEEQGRKIPLIEFSKANELPHGDIIKFFIWNMDEKTVKNFESNCNGKKNMNCVQSVRGTLDVDPAEATKGSGLKFLSKHLNMRLENTAAIGDNKNDLDMLQSVGFPVAVANAEDVLKQAAWKICPSNDDCGVAVMLEEFMRE